MVEGLLNKYPLISEQVSKKELRIILNNLKEVLESGVPGDIIEMGCYLGTTSLFISRLIKNLESDVNFHVYDSFEGLPEKTNKDSSPAGVQFIGGELKATKKQFVNNYRKAGLKIPEIHKAWFSELGAEGMPKKISFAFLDGDYYESIKFSLNLVESRLSQGSVVIVDDYLNEALPGAKKAVDEWIKKINLGLKVSESLAIIKRN